MLCYTRQYAVQISRAFNVIRFAHESSVFISSISKKYFKPSPHFLCTHKTGDSLINPYVIFWRNLFIISSEKRDIKINQCKYIKNIERNSSKSCNIFQTRKNSIIDLQKNFSTTSICPLFWENDPKGGYGKPLKVGHKQMIRDGLKELRKELSKWQEEVKEKFECDPIYVFPGNCDKVFVLNNEDSLKQWITTSDSDHGEGFSQCTLTLSPTGHGLFSGNISTQIPKDGKTKSAGYCNIKSTRPRKSFKRDVYHDWSLYNTLVLRVRGDGRSYMITINTGGYFDNMWNDLYSYILHTRGGPHWQVTKIPFSKFFLSSKGRVQDNQMPIPLMRVESMGISSGDRINAPFRLEIDHVSLYNDPINTETFAYEMYKLPRYMSNE